MTTPILGLAELESAQSLKFLTINQVFNYLDALVNLTVFNRTETTAPVSPTAGDRYIVASPATGDFLGQENNIAVFIGSQWVFFTPSNGWKGHDQGADEKIRFDGTDWVIDGATGANGNAASPAYSFTDDPDTGMYRNAANELGFSTGGSERFKLTNAQASSSMGNWLLNHAGTDSLLILNKDAAGDDASLTFQQGFSHQASMGIQGSNNFAIKVGAGFTTAVEIDNSTGDVTFPAQTSIRTLIPFGGRWTMESTDNRWNGPQNYSFQETNSSNAGTGADPNIDWDAKGTHYIPSGSILHKLRLTWNINNAEVTDVFWKLYFQYTTFDGNTDTTGEVTRVELNGGTFTPAGSATGMNASDLISSDYTCPGEGYLLLYCKPNGTLTADRYFQTNGALDLTYQGL